MRGARKPVPEHLRHRIVAVGATFELQTYYGYVLCSFATTEDAQAYYVRHCQISAT